MLATCAISSIQFQLPYFNGIKQAKSSLSIHPIFTSYTLNQLLQFKASYYMSSSEERYLYWLACLNALSVETELVLFDSTISIADANDQLLIKHLPNSGTKLVQILAYSKQSYLPQFRLQSNTFAASFEWLDECIAIISSSHDTASKKLAIKEAEKEAHKQKIIARAQSMYPLKLANWLAEYTEFPQLQLLNYTKLANAKKGDTLASYWIRIVHDLLKNPANYWIYQDRVINELTDHITDYPLTDSTNGLAILKMLNSIESEKHTFNGFGSSIKGATVANVDESKVMQNTLNMLTDSGVVIPTDKPNRADYPNLVSYAKALSAYNIVQSSKESKQ